jgi:cell division protein FtsW (lipid II flippase)
MKNKSKSLFRVAAATALLSIGLYCVLGYAMVASFSVAHPEAQDVYSRRAVFWLVGAVLGLTGGIGVVGWIIAGRRRDRAREGVAPVDCRCS